MIENLSGFIPSKFDTPEIKLEKEKKVKYNRQERCYSTSHCSGDLSPLEAGNQTLLSMLHLRALRSSSCSYHGS